MKIYLTLVISLFSLASAQSQLTAPALSPRSIVSQKLGLTDISVVYSRPSARGRKIFGPKGIVPYGEYWRTGANAVTKFEVGDDISINGQKLERGDYAVLSTVQADHWTLHFYPYERLPWDKYVDKSPSLSVTAKRRKSDKHTETLFLGLENIQLDNADLVLEWDDVRVEFPITASAQDKMLKAIDRALAGPSNNDYYQAALYLHEANLQLDAALKYIREVTKSERATFFQVYREAIILEELGRHDEAVVVARRGKKLAEQIGNKDFIRLNNKIINGS